MYDKTYKCENCGVRPATTESFVNVDGQERKVRLCGYCYNSLTEYRASRHPAGYKSFIERPQKVCEVCKTTEQQIEESIYVGCSNCYKVFREQILSKIYTLHKSRIHKRRKDDARKSGSSDEELALMMMHYRQAVEENRREDAEELLGFIEDYKKNKGGVD